jgi:hypothetical protein
MGRVNKNLNENSIVKINAKFFKKTDVPAFLGQRYDFSSPGLTLNGRTVSKRTNDEGKIVFNVILDDLPGMAYTLYGTQIKYVGPVPETTTPDNNDGMEDMEIDADLGGEEDDDEDDVLDDAIQDPDEVDEVDRPEHDDYESENNHSDDDYDSSDDDGTWLRRGLVADSRITSRQGFTAVKARMNMNNPETSSPLDFFLRFLPVDHIRNFIIPCTNDHARSVNSNWKDLTWLEYLTWMALMIHMMIWKNSDVKAYWRMADIGSFISIDFGNYMTHARFLEIIKWHVFKIPDGQE